MEKSAKPSILQRWITSAKSLAQQRPHTTAAVGIAGVAMLANSSFAFVGPGQIAVRETLGVLTSEKVIGPGIYIQFPFIQFTHVYNTNVQKTGMGAGSNYSIIPWSSNTGDQNVLLADLAVHYQVQKDVAKIAPWRWQMRDWFAPNGYWTITWFMNQSANSVMGRRPMAETLADPKRFAAEVFQDLKMRLDQNNVPVTLQSLEVKRIRTSFWPAHSVSYQIEGTAPNSQSIPPEQKLLPPNP